MKKSKRIARARLILPEDVAKIDGLQIDEEPFLLAFTCEDSFYLIKSDKWSLEDSLSLIMRLKTDIDKISDKLKKGPMFYIL